MLDRYDQDLLLDYLEGELDEHRRAELDAMLAEDPQLAALLSEMMSDRAVLRALPHEEAPADLVNDVTKTLERRMLLDDPVEDLGPIPMSRGRSATVEPTRSISWGRVIGLTGLAASVALVAGVLVIMFEDPLLDTANELAASTPTEEAETAAESWIADEDNAAADSVEGIAARDKPDATPGAPTAEGLAETEADALTAPPDSVANEALARVDDKPDRANTPGTPGLNRPTDAAGGSPTEAFTVGTTAAISALHPRQQLVLLSESPEVSLEQLIEFCVANGIAVVQPEQLALNQARPKAVENNKLVGDALGEDAEDAEDIVVSDYALLINETQLESLLMTLNNEVTLDPKRAGKASLISNQAALVADLPKDDARYGVYLQDALEEAGDEDADPAPRSANQLEQANQQAIQLRNPDLGSSYANTRNRYNLQQQANYGQREALLADTQDSADKAAGTKSAKAIHGHAEKVDPELAADLLLKEQADAPVQEQKDAEGLTADRATIERRESVRQIDPTRGNWLSAHLPVADTTPLLLQWREDSHVKEQTKLVPVMVQRAAPDRVNTLRQRQQIEYANRSRASEAKPAEAQPAKPAEPAK